MAVKSITLRLVAFSDAAGKYEPDAPLNGNEDNFFVDDDLSDDITGPTRTNTDVPLSDAGCLMAVADGMGGQNAGEVASEIAVDTIADYFRRDRITPRLLASAEARAEYIKSTIVEADRRVKAGVEGHPERDGMGSTIIIAWIVGDDLTVGWLGDSRAYRFNPRTGLQPVSKDHTYVQELADKGILTYEETFGHPQGNIVTRSLGDPGVDPSPESVNVKLCNGDVVLLCSDGLSGVLPDRPMRDIHDSIETIMSRDYNNLAQMRVDLMDVAKRQHWYDNVTVLLCRVDGAALAAPPRRRYSKEFVRRTRRNNIILAILAVVLIAVAAAICINFFKGSPEPKFSASPADTLTTATAETPAVTEPEAVEPQKTMEQPPQRVQNASEAIASGAPRVPASLPVPGAETVEQPAPQEAAPAEESSRQGNWKELLVKKLVALQQKVPVWDTFAQELISKIEKSPLNDTDTRLQLNSAVNRLTGLQTYYFAVQEDRKSVV